MRIPAMIAAELRRLTATPMAVAALAALMTVPLLYGGLYLWANKDPYAALDRIPAAIVVADEGATQDGDAVTYGEDVAEQLVEDGTFDWRIVSRADAVSGVSEEDFDFAITFPADFSDALASASGDDPHQARVTLTTSDVNSYLASTIGEQAAEAIRVSIVETVNEEAAARFLLGLADVRSSLVDAADGAATLSDGLDDAHDGSSALATGTSRLATGASTLADGASTLDTGAADLADGVGSLADGASDLADGVDSLASGAEDLAAGASRVADGNAALAEKADAVGEAAQDAADRIPEARVAIEQALLDSGLSRAQVDDALAALDPVAGQLADANDAVQSTVDDIDALADGAAAVADGARRLTDGAEAAASGASDLAEGASTAADGAARVATGAASVADGSGTLATGAAEAASGAEALDDGLDSLAAGATRLTGGLEDGVTQIPDSDQELRDRQAQTIANPVDLRTSQLTTAGTYGAGLAPFFISLAGWIGIYALFLIVKPVSKRAITAIHSPVRITLAGWLTPGALGALQMAGLFAVVSMALGFGFDHAWGAFGIMALASFTFAAVILALNVWLGSVGQFLGLVLMVVQLVTAGGTFPWQTLPAPLAALHHVLPMSFAVDGIRQVMYGGSAGAAWGDAAMLAAWMVGALLVAAVGVTRMTHRRTLRDLQPSLIG
ncbi:YhgE/Pip family protein [Demequina phytophila]|uniref:YhgE/Pip family protein n=1 Tax=Demequina phytophila TaxID=1638981 RepID=UPI000781EBC1|nr:YhgE/Pip domain-containing protein [Demequina phytophila]